MENLYDIESLLGNGNLSIKYHNGDDEIIITNEVEDQDIYIEAESFDSLIEELKEFSEMIKNSKIREIYNKNIKK